MVPEIYCATDRQMDGWMVRWMDEQTDGQTDGKCDIQRWVPHLKVKEQ